MAHDWEARVEAVRRALVAAFADVTAELPARLLAELRGACGPSALWPDLEAVAAHGEDAGLAARVRALTEAQRLAVGEYLDLLLDAATSPVEEGALSNPFYRTHGSHHGSPWPVLRCVLQGWSGCGHPVVARARALDEAARQPSRHSWRRRDLAALAARVEQAFAARVKPPVGPPPTRGDWAFCSFEWQRFDWRCADPEVVRQALPRLAECAPTAVAYVLPAGLRAGLVGLDRDEAPTAEFRPLLVPEPRPPSDFGHFSPEAIAALSRELDDAERAVVSDYLALLAADQPARAEAIGAAADTYWRPGGPVRGAGSRVLRTVRGLGGLASRLAGVVTRRRDLTDLLPAWMCEPLDRPRYDRAAAAAVRASILAAAEEWGPPRDRRAFVPGTDAADGLEARWRRLVSGRRWQDVPAEAYTQFEFTWCDLEPVVFRYYLPGFLLTLLERGGSDCALRPSLHDLAARRVDEGFARRRAALSAGQQRAVCDLLGLRLEHETHLAGARPLYYGWADFDHPAVERARAVYHRLHHHSWPRAQDAEVRELLTQLHTAFADTPAPRDAITGELGDWEADEYALEFRDLEWRTVHPALLNACNAAPSFFSPAAFRYFLPAFVQAELMGEAYGDIGYHLVANFTGRNGFALADVPDGLGQWRARLGGVLAQISQVDWRSSGEDKCREFSRPEREALIAFLRWTARQTPDEGAEIEQAVARYWLPSLSTAP